MWSAFALHCRTLGLPLSEVNSLRQWAERMLLQCRPHTVARYLSHVTVMNERVFGPPLGTQAAHLSDLRASLARLGAGAVRSQATPATAADVRAIWQLAPRDVGLISALLWGAAMRFGDLAAVTPSDVHIDGDSVELTLRRTKTSSFGGPPRTVAFRLPPQALTALRGLLDTTRPLLFRTPYPAFLREVRRVCPHLTAHSFRRGAVQVAMASGAGDADVMRLTGHKSLESLATYAGRLPVTWRAQMLLASTATLW